jgi:hypothetical protein
MVGDHVIFTDYLIGQGHCGSVYLAFEVLSICNQTVKIDLKNPLACKVIKKDMLT